MSYGFYCRLNVHVMHSNMEVVRRAWPKFTPDAKTRARRTARHEFLRSVLMYHSKARDLYDYVATGG